MDDIDIMTLHWDITNEKKEEYPTVRPSRNGSEKEPTCPARTTGRTHIQYQTACILPMVSGALYLRG